MGAYSRVKGRAIRVIVCEVEGQGEGKGEDEGERAGEDEGEGDGRMGEGLL
mgnify:CR=1 FL=1|jgi:hypothetical protein